MLGEKVIPRAMRRGGRRRNQGEGGREGTSHADAESWMNMVGLVE